MTLPTQIDPARTRDPDHEIEPLLVERWSPRAMSGEPIERDTLLRVFEAARWAPSSRNRQPWRYLYALRGTGAFDAVYGLLADGNQAWCADAAALVVAGSVTRTPDGKEIRTHAFDSGAAWENLALQGSAMGLVVHAMEGFDARAARRVLRVPDGVALHAVIAVGHPGPVEALPDASREREHPSGRRPVASFVREGASWPREPEEFNP